MKLKIQRATRKIKHFRLKVIVVAVIILSLCASSAIAVANTVTTEVVYGGEVKSVSTFSEDPNDIIEKAEFNISSDDKIDLSDFDTQSEKSIINIIKASEVSIYEDGELVKVVKTTGKVGDALKKAGVELSSGDEIEPEADNAVYNGMSINIAKAFGVTLVVDKDVYHYNVTKGTVSDILKMAKVTIGEYDKISVKPKTELKAKMKIKVVKAESEKYTEEIPIDYTTKTEYSSALYVGQSEVTQKGVEGVETKTYKKITVGGKEVKTELLSSEITKEATEEIIVYGTKELVTTTEPITAANVTKAASPNSRIISELSPTIDIKLDSNGRPTNFKKVLTGSATAYYGGYLTASGETPMPGRVAVNPQQLPYGTKMYIVSSDGKYVYGYCEASDTGGFVDTGNTIVDLYFNTYDECCQFGRRNVEIYIF